MYNDKGSTGIVWENRFVHETQSAGNHQHYGRDNIVRNCIVARGADEHIRWRERATCLLDEMAIENQPPKQAGS